MPYKTRKDLHLLRKIWHMIAGSIFVYLYEFRLNQKEMLQFVLAVTVVYVFGEFIRFQLPKLNNFGVKMFKSVIRENEIDRVHGGVYFAISSLIVVIAFPRQIAILSVLFLGLGDPLASFFGILFGSNGQKIFRKKSLVGSLACAVACTIACALMLEHWAFGLAASRLILISTICGLSAALAEALPLPFDDNLTIPLLSGSVAWTMFTFLGLPI